jgi:hypothetical protein
LTHLYRATQAAAHNIPVVLLAWVEACQSAAQFVEPGPFRVQSEAGPARTHAGPADELGVLVLPAVVVRRQLSGWDPSVSVAPVDYNPESSSFPEASYDVVRCDVFYANDQQQFRCLELHVGESRPGVFCFRVFLQSATLALPAGGSKLCFSLPSMDAAELYYVMRFEEFALDAKWKRVHLLNYAIGSERAKQCGLAFVGPASSSSLDPAVAQLVDHLFDEAMGRLSSWLTLGGTSSPLGTLSLQQVQSADAVLLEMFHLLRSDRVAEYGQRIETLSSEFSGLLPQAASPALATLQDVEEQHELLELLTNLLSVGELGPSVYAYGSQTDLRYKALNCHIAALDAQSDTFKSVREAVVAAQVRAKEIEVVNVYVVSRRAEAEAFADAVPNVRMLFHGSRISSWVGILSKVKRRGMRQFGQTVLVCLFGFPPILNHLFVFLAFSSPL